MLSTLLISSIPGTYVLVGMVGISWAVTIWAPFAIISIELSAEEEASQRIGTVIGLHNVAIAVPQILAALLCGLVFWLFDVFGSTQSGQGLGWVVRMGGLSAIVAAVLTTKLKVDGGRKVEYSKLEDV